MAVCGTTDINPCLRRVIRQLVWCHAHDVSVLIVEVFSLRVLDAFELEVQDVQAASPS
jgi:hypothetical protein